MEESKKVVVINTTGGGHDHLMDRLREMIAARYEKTCPIRVMTMDELVENGGKTRELPEALRKISDEMRFNPVREMLNSSDDLTRGVDKLINAGRPHGMEMRDLDLVIPDISEKKNRKQRRAEKRRKKR